MCVGFTKEYAEKIDKYICKKCVTTLQEDVVKETNSHGGGVSGGVSMSVTTSGTTISDSQKSVSSLSQLPLPKSLSTTPSSTASRTVVTTSSSGTSQQLSLPSGGTGLSPDLMKGLLQNPQLAAQLLSLPLK